MASSYITSLNDGNFDAQVLSARVPVLVFFTASWSVPAKSMAPILDRIADERASSAKVYVVDIDDSPNVTKKYAVRSVPMVLAFKGGKQTGSQNGPTTFEKLKQLL